MSHRDARGNALPETALTISMVMVVFLGVIRLAMTGYQQSEADGASFVAAHAASLHNDDTAAQVTVGQQHAKADFSRASAVVTAGTANSGPYDNGIAIGATSLLAQSVFGPSFADVNLHSQVQEPVVGVQSGSVTGNGVVDDTNTKLVNCETDNPATPTCVNPYLARPDPTNTTDPLKMYDCHLAFYAALAGGTNGTTRGTTPWPDNYQAGTRGSINDPTVRLGGVYLTVAGTYGTALSPIAKFGTGADPCAGGATPAPSAAPSPPPTPSPVPPTPTPTATPTPVATATPKCHHGEGGGGGGQCPGE